MQLRGILLLWLITATVVAGTEKLRFKYSQTDKILLSWDETWEVGAPNMMAFLNVNKPLTIKVAVEGDAGSAYRSILRFKCRQGGDFSTMDLMSLIPSTSESQCNDDITFTVRLMNADRGEYEFTLQQSPLLYQSAFDQKLELAVSVESGASVILSNSLFVWNLDILSQLNGKQASDKSYTRRFLTDDAIGFLKRMDMNTDSSFGSLMFLDSEVSKLIERAPAFLRAKINLGAVLNFDAGSCESYQMSRASLFVNYHSMLDERTQNLLKHMYLNVQTSKLHYSTYGLSSAISDFFASMNPFRIGICSTLSFAGQGQPYDRTLSIEQRIDIDQLSYKVYGSKFGGCQIPDNIGSRPITIYSGMDFTPLVCPIICSDPNEVYRFMHVNSEHRVINLVPDSRRDWTEVDGIRISKTGNIIEFPPTTYNRHAGQYRCEAGGKQFTFNAQVITMPQFTFKSYESSAVDVSGNLPPVIYAMEGESVSFGCTAFYANMESVTIAPVFYTAATIGTSAWRKLSLDDFNSLVGTTPSNILSMELDTKAVDNQTLKLTVHKVPPAKVSTGVNFTHHLLCNASVSQMDAVQIGMPSYSVQSSSNVFFIARPTPNSFDLSKARNCSVQGCSISSGAEFAVSLKPDLSAYLRSIGVEVVGMFKIDDVYLTDLNIINQRGVSEIKFDSLTNRLVFKVHPISDTRVLEELQKRKTLTPVFNLRYAAGSSLASLQMKKEPYGARDVAAGERDCRADPRCFYSTEYDVAGSLQSIVMSISFKEPAGKNNNITVGKIAGEMAAAVGWLLVAGLCSALY